MSDLLHKLLKFVDYERGKVIGVALGIVIVLCAYGCEVKLTSPFSNNKVTSEQFSVELSSAKAKLESKMELLDIEMKELVANGEITVEEFAKWENLKEEGFGILGGVVTSMVSGGGVDLAQIGVSIIALAGLGGTAGGWLDSARKNKVIETEKAKNISTV
jgi:hypothetical protein